MASAKSATLITWGPLPAWRSSIGARRSRTHEFPGEKYKGIIERLVFDKDGKWLFAAGGDHGGFIKFFDLATKKVIHQDKAPMHIHDVSFDETQTHLYAAGHGKLVVWKMA